MDNWSKQDVKDFWNEQTLPSVATQFFKELKLNSPFAVDGRHVLVCCVFGWCVSLEAADTYG